MSDIPSKDFLRSALEEASAPALLMSMIHMTGDTSVLNANIVPKKPIMVDIQCGLSAQEQAQVREQAFACITQFFSSATNAPAELPKETIEQMLAFSVGEQRIADSHREMVYEELAITGEDLKRVDIDQAARANAGIKVAIIGAGMSGLLMAMRLQQAGVEYEVFEKSDGVGGTWYENRYPGCRVDIASNAYSYSFEPDYRWKHAFGQHQELRDYFADFANRHELLQHIRFNTTVESTEYDEDSNSWTLHFERDGQAQQSTAQLVVSAVGQLNRPKIPNVPGRESFAGVQMHTAQWDTSVDLTGKRVAVVGSGATAFQMVPELAKTASELTVFQRTPQWMIPNPDYHMEFTAEHIWLFDNLPGYARWYRFLSLWPMLDKATPQLLIDPDWDDDGLSCSRANQKTRERLGSYIASQVKDPELLEKVMPKYPPFGTRILQDNGSWLSSLQRDNVDVLAESVGEVTKTGVISASGQTKEVDAIVWATGFETDTFVAPMEVVGKNGTRLADVWSPLPKAHLGMAVPEFPNFFCLYGPNANVAHTSNIILVSECQVRYLMHAIKLMCEQGISSLECKAEVADDYEERMDSALAKMVWSHPSVHGFYRLGDSGRVVVNMPWNACEYWNWTKQFDSSEYHCA